MSPLLAHSHFCFVLVVAVCMATGVASCSGARTKVEVASNPSGAEVVTFEGKKLGVTPLVLDGEQVERTSRSGRLSVVISAPGYLERELVMETHGTESYKVRLTKADQDYFSKKLLTDFSAETNKMARELMQMHGLVLAGKLDEAEKLLSEFQKQFPNIAASYVLSASIENQRGKRDSARRYLMRANQIDPNDPVVLRMLGATQ